MRRRSDWRGLALPGVCALFLFALTLGACARAYLPPGPGLGAIGLTEPTWQETRFVADDGFVLPARWWAERGIATYAYDQRGFGATEKAGLWPGAETLADDAAQALSLLRQKHPGAPLYLLGESMGGAVALVLMTRPMPPALEGVILAAPAVWARATMPFYQRWSLWLAVTFVPGWTPSPSGLDIQASDNIAILRELGSDPLVIKEARIDAIAGLADLMDRGLAAGREFRAKSLFLYGEKDEVIPPEPTLELWRSLPANAAMRQRLALYENGWHLLLRDLEAEIVWRDIEAWIENAERQLPSGADKRAVEWIAEQASGA